MAATAALTPQSYHPPSPQSPYLSVRFANAGNNNSSSTSPLWPATSLQLSFRAGEKEAFTERLTLRDLVPEDDGGFSVRVGERGIPRFSPRPDHVVVTAYAWKGERFMGLWEVGRM